MNEPNRLPENVEVVVNPSLKLSVVVDLRRRDLPTSRFEFSDREGLRLARWLIDQIDEGAATSRSESGQVELELRPEQLQRALASGCLLLADQVPESPPPFKCALDPGLLDLVPRPLLDRLRPACADRRRLRASPGLILQQTAELPAALADEVQMGPELWTHLKGIRPDGHDRFSADRPVLWVPQGATGTYQPLWAGEALTIDRVQAALAGGDLTDLSEDELLLLLLGEVLLPPDADSGGSAVPPPLQGVAHLGRVMSGLQIAAVRHHFRRLRRAGYFQTDHEQVVDRRDGMYCEAVSMFLQRALTSWIGAVTGQKVMPSYTWVMRYRPGAALERHTDRPQCRWNVSLCLDAENDRSDLLDWPIFFDVGGSVRSVNLQMGEAVLYSGTDTPHWRHPLGADEAVTIVFLHYVNADFKGKLG
jgi:hypothetical protein